MEEFLRFLLTAGGLVLEIVLIVSGPVLIAISVLRPVDKAIRVTHKRLQFELIDFLWLLIQLQIALAFVAGYIPRREHAWFFLFLAFLTGATVAMWWGSTQAMLRAGVSGRLRRALFVLFVLPGTLALMMGVTMFYMSVPVALFMAYNRVRQNSYSTEREQVFWGLVAFVAVTVFAPVCCWGMRRLVFWILSPEGRAVGTRQQPGAAVFAELRSSPGDRADE